MVATGKAEPNKRHDKAPATPTTPVEKPVKIVVKRNEAAVASGAGIINTETGVSRPSFHPPIPQTSSAVRLDLSGSATSAFRVVEPREGRRKSFTPTSLPVAPRDVPRGAMVRRTSSDDSGLVAVSRRISAQLNTKPITPVPLAGRSMIAPPKPTTSFRRQGRYSGPADAAIEDASANNSFSSPGPSEATINSSNTSTGIVKVTPRHLITSNKQRHSPIKETPNSPSTPVIANTSGSGWLQHQKEPFQRILPVSPPVSPRQHMLSGMTLPQVQTSPGRPCQSPPMSPPLSPLELDGSIVASIDSSDCMGQHLSGPSTSPPMSPFQADAMLAKLNKDAHLVPVSPPISTLKVSCSPSMMESALSIPLPMTPTTPSSGITPTHPEKPRHIIDRVQPRDLVPKHDHQDSSNKTRQKESASSPRPMSPPLLNRTKIANKSAWLQHSKEPYQLEQQEIMAQHHQQPTSPPISDANFVTSSEVGAASMDLMTISPTSSSRPTLKMTKTLLEELRQSQTGKAISRQKRKKKKRKASSSRRERLLMSQLHNAQQVVRIILKGTGDPNIESMDFGPQACYEAIRVYALLKIESEGCLAQLKNSKQQLKELYCEWKSLRKEMQEEHHNRASQANTIVTHDSLAVLQQLLSDDESIYIEEDNTMDNDDCATVTTKGAASFAMSVKVDQEKDLVKAIGTLYREMQHELEDMRSVWQDQRAQQRKRQLEGEKERRVEADEDPLFPPARLDDNNNQSSNNSDHAEKQLPPINPLEENDSFLLAKIEELTAQIETMQNDRVILSGFMDQLAQEVIRADAAESHFEADLGIAKGTVLVHPEDWTTFGDTFPIHRVNELDEEASVKDGGDAVGSPSLKENDLAHPPDTNTPDDSTAEQSSKEKALEQEAFTTPVKSNQSNIQKESVWRRSGQFHASYDSDADMNLPVNLPRSRGASFDRDTPSDIHEEDLGSKLEEKLNKLQIFREDKDEDDDINSFGSLEQSISSMVSFDSFLARRRFSEPTISSLTRSKLHGALLCRKTKDSKKSTLAREGEALFGKSDSSAGFEKSVLSDEESKMSYSASQDGGGKRPPVLDSQLTRKLESPSLGLQMSLPRKVPSMSVDQTDESALSRPSSPEGTDDTDPNKGYVRLCSKLLQSEEELRQTKVQLSLLDQKQKQLVSELHNAKAEARKWEGVSRNPAGSSASCRDIESVSSNRESKPQAKEEPTSVLVRSHEDTNETEPCHEKQESAKKDECPTTERKEALEDVITEEGMKVENGSLAGNENAAQEVELNSPSTNAENKEDGGATNERVHPEGTVESEGGTASDSTNESGEMVPVPANDSTSTSNKEGKAESSTAKTIWKKASGMNSMFVVMNGRTPSAEIEALRLQAANQNTQDAVPASRPSINHKAGGDIEVKLLEKAEECERLTSQVTCLAEQLEQQMSNVTRLEAEAAGHVRERKATENLTQQQSKLIQALRTERDLSQRIVVQRTGELAKSREQIEVLKAKINQLQGDMMDSSSDGSEGRSTSGASGSALSSSPRMSSGAVKARVEGIRTLFSRGKRLASVVGNNKQDKKNLLYAPMEGDCHDEDEDLDVSKETDGDQDRQPTKKQDTGMVPTADGAFGVVPAPSGGSVIGSIGGDGQDMMVVVVKTESEEDESTATSVATGAAVPFVQFQRKNSMDFSAREDIELTAIHSLTKRIEELEDENARLRRSGTGQQERRE
ncbi:expressed unknown protein [Seminavis robusta]|uniref:Uncharacterized protein n=1 Tax=Seminavis robusta TaxID=568900 RepID=A0A9N8DW31_9STRA|nr:expressed unknown protein [Seminavis robusta]|eukprot:Sro290_g109290.1 n/a (1710) ;mRNA; f:31971-37100